MFRTVFAAVFLAALSIAPAAPAAAPTLTERAILPARLASAPRARPSAQPVGGFSALLDAPGRDTYFAMPDNGFGTKANSRSFLLRVYRVRANWDRGDVKVLDSITLRDPRRRIPFELVNEDTAALLTGGDLDVESFRRDRRGDALVRRRVRPVPPPHGRARHRARGADPAARRALARLPRRHPPSAPATSPRSNGFEGMAISPDGRTLYPTLEGPLADDADKTIRRMYTFDIAKRRYVAGHRTYRVADPSHLVSDLTALDSRRFVSLERDNLQGPAAVHKQAFVVDTRHGALTKRKVLDELNIADPKGISLRGPVRPGDFGLGNPFRMPYQTIEAVLPVGGERARDRQRHELRLDGPQPVAAGLQRLHPRAGARAAGAPLASAASPSCHSEKLISPHSCREWSSRRATCSSIRRVTAAGSK